MSENRAWQALTDRADQPAALLKPTRYQIVSPKHSLKEPVEVWIRDPEFNPRGEALSDEQRSRLTSLVNQLSASSDRAFSDLTAPLMAACEAEAKAGRGIPVSAEELAMGVGHAWINRYSEFARLITWPPEPGPERRQLRVMVRPEDYPAYERAENVYMDNLRAADPQIKRFFLDLLR